MAAMKYQVDNTRWGTPTTVDSSMFYEFVLFISSVFFNTIPKV